MGKLEDETPKSPIYINAAVGAAPAPNNVADVVGVEIHLNIFIITGNLKGVTKPLFTIGKMTDEFIKVIRVFQKQIVGSSNPDGRVDPNGTTLKFLNGPISARGGKMDPGKLTPPASVATARKQIAETAGVLQREGGHFLMACSGDMPGRANGHPVRPAFTRPAVLLERSHELQLGPAVNAAWTSIKGFPRLGCMGAPKKLKGLVHEDGRLPPGDPKLALLDKYVERVGVMRDVGVANHFWPGLDFYETRAAAFDAATTRSEFLSISKPNNSDGHFPHRTQPFGLIHLGQSCVDRRHYDCIGFVNFVLSKVLSAKFSQTMEFFTKSSTRFKVQDVVGKDISLIAEEGDIVLKSLAERHCGVCRIVSGQMVVTNCRSMEDGLLNSSIVPEWSFLARLISV